MSDHDGYIKLYRKSVDSAVFQDPGLWKLWCLCLLKANHKRVYVKVDGLAEPVLVEPGQFITGRYSLHADYHAKKRVNTGASPFTLWRWMQTLQSMQNLSIKTSNKYSIITITNWDTYQGSSNKNEQQNAPQVSSRRAAGEQQVSTNKNDKNENKSQEEISRLLSRYPNRTLMDNAFKAISLTRKSNRIADTVKMSILERLTKYPVEEVEAGIRIYLGKDYASEGKREEYLLGIIKQQRRNGDACSQEVPSPSRLTCWSCHSDVWQYELKEGKCPSCGEAISTDQGFEQSV